MKTPHIRTAAIAALLALLFALTSCGGGQVAPTDTTKTAASTPKRIVALDWRFEEMLVSLGIQPVGIVEIGDSKAPTSLKGKLDGITSVGQAKQPNLEVIASLKPDLILASPSRQGQIMNQLKEIAPTEAYPDNTYSEVLDSLDRIAAKTGTTDQAKKVRSDLDTKMAAARKAIKPGTRAVVAGWSSNSLYTWVDKSFPGTLLAEVGYEYAYAGDASKIESKTDVAQLTGDKLPAMKADVLYLYNDQAGFRATPYASAAGRIVDVDNDTWSRARGPLSAAAMLDQIATSSS